MKLSSAFIIFLSLFTYNDCYALSVKSTGAIHEEMIRKFVDVIIIPIISTQFQYRERLENVEIVVTKNILDTETAISISGENPQIVLSDGFIYALYNYAEAFLVEKSIGYKHFRESYFSYRLWRRPRFYEGDAPKTPLEWSKYTPPDKKSFEKTVKVLATGAILDVLFHEVGHHALNAFYSINSSDSLKRDIESKVDKWASKVQYDYSGDWNGLGRVIAIGYIFELERWSGFSGQKSHPQHLFRVRTEVDSLCDDLGTKYKNECGLLKKEIMTHLGEPFSIKEYSKRVDDGDVYANYPLAELLWKSGRFKEACTHYETFFSKTFDIKAAINLGYCFENGYMMWGSKSDEKKMAKFLYKKASDEGFVEAKKRLESVK